MSAPLNLENELLALTRTCFPFTLRHNESYQVRRNAKVSGEFAVTHSSGGMQNALQFVKAESFKAVETMLRKHHFQGSHLTRKVFNQDTAEETWMFTHENVSE